MNPDGLSLIYDFITKEEENEIVNHIEKTPRRKTADRNSVKRYGIGASYQDNIVSKTIPLFLQNLSQKLIDQNLIAIKPKLISINEYYSGQTISSHIDSKESGDVITTLSLFGHATMIFQKGKTKIPIELPPRCLVQMRDEARNLWLHSISPVQSTRYSIVFRM